MAETGINKHGLDARSTLLNEKTPDPVIHAITEPESPEFNEKAGVLVNAAPVDSSSEKTTHAPPPKMPKLVGKKSRSQVLKKRISPMKIENIPAPPPIPKSHRASYAPVVPSPLNPSKTGSEDSTYTNSTGSQRNSYIHNTSSSSPERRLSGNNLVAASFADLGRGYDRYPVRTPRGSVNLSESAFFNTTSTQKNTNLLAAPSELNPAIDVSDPEKGFLQNIGTAITTDSNPSLQGGFPLYMDEKEADDYLHNPEDDFDSKRENVFKNLGVRGWFNFACFVLFIAGVLSLFIVLPVLTFSGKTNISNGPASDDPFLEPWEYVETRYEFPILGGIRSNLIDPDTPKSALTRKSVNGGNMKLVFSDEFNVDGRSFYEGDDQFWQAADLHYAATNDLEWYEPDAISTEAGTLRIKLDAFKNHDLNYRSGMLQSWNKLCFKGGVLEVSASLAGPGGKVGLWPGIWTLGNLARPGYLATSEGVWPYAYDHCDVGITPNQSSSDGISYLPGQKLAKCACSGEDHPNPGTGRGAPEIDALEGSTDGGLSLGVASQSSQIAPYDVWYLPDYDYMQIYNYSVTEMNTYTGGPFQQAISGVTSLNNNWYDGNQFQKYGFEYKPGTGTGYISWFVGDEPTFKMLGEATGQNGNIGARDISREPMSIVLNLGVSNSWAYIDWPALRFPTTMYIDYVRIYQPEGQESITCDPEGFPTTKYIKDHLNAYMNPNLTSWKDAGYTYPKNDFMHGC